MIEEFDEQEILMNKENQKLMNLFSFLVWCNVKSLHAVASHTGKEAIKIVINQRDF